MNKNLFLLIVTVILTLFSSCKKESDNQDSIQIVEGERIAFISNEGAFGFGNSSLSIYYPDSGVIENQVFEKINNRKPGDVMQSVNLIGNSLFLIINASNKIEKLDAKTLEQSLTIGNFSLPRYMVANSENRGFISCWGETGVVKVLDLNSGSIISTLPTGNGPEKMLIHKDKLIVCNSGGFANDSTLSIFDLNTLELDTLIVVGDQPMDILEFDQNSVWVLCRGKMVYGSGGQLIEETAGSIVRIEPQTGNITEKVMLQSNQHPAHLEISPDKASLYLGGGYGFHGVYKYQIATQQLDAIPLIDKSLYGFNVDSKTGNIYGLEAPTFTQAGWLNVYSPTGFLMNRVKTGIGPNMVCFKD